MSSPESDRPEHGNNQATVVDPTAQKTHGRGSSRKGRGQGNSTGRGGRGRGRRSPSGAGRGRSWNNSRPSPKTELVTCDFPSMHQKCGAARYKVHKPGCSCSKVKKARSALSSPTTSESHDNKIDDASPSNLDSSRTMEEPLDGLIVIPESGSISLVYLCKNTGAEEFVRDQFATEKRLEGEMFSSDKVPTFKASCASCLLEEVPNGFVCVSSSARQTVDFARDVARKEADKKRKEGKLHSDHAHYICSLPKHTMCNLNQARTRQQTREIADQVAAQFSQQGIPATSGENVEFGHHLKSLISLNSRADSDALYWLVLVYDDRKGGGKKDPCWTIDLPGGKRHLGETTFEGAVRETEEEMSLMIDEQWKMETTPRRSRHSSDKINAYYFVTPPTDVLVTSLEASFSRLLDSKE